MINIIELDTAASTNTELVRLAAEGAPHGTVVTCRCQTAGRGQRGNSWEAEPGKNITMSLLLRGENIPAVPASLQYAFSEHVAVAVADVVRSLLPDPDTVAVKWPNDIYVGDRKIAGILIECALQGSSISHIIVGLGLNVNQTRFVSDAPNPVSLANLLGRTLNLRPLTARLASRMIDFTSDERKCSEWPFPCVHERYLSMLWRRSGLHPYLDLESGERFTASIAGVAPDGRLLLDLPDGTRRAYWFRTLRQLLS